MSNPKPKTLWFAQQMGLDILGLDILGTTRYFNTDIPFMSI